MAGQGVVEQTDRPFRSKAANQKESSPREKMARLNKLRRACADLESIFVGEMLKAARQAAPKSGAIPEAPGADVYQSMADQQFARYLSQGQGLGLGQAVYNRLVFRENLIDLDRAHPEARGLSYKNVVPAEALHRRPLASIMTGNAGSAGQTVPGTELTPNTQE
ncbi:MAG: rod-binding protein [Thermodesulfobacteriota bacterium]